VITVHCNYPPFGILLGHAFEVLIHFVCNFEEGGKWRGLMIGPLIIPDSPIEKCVIVYSAADVNDEVVAGVLLVEICNHVFNAIAIGLFD
jgi:hypothetical protein